MIEQRIESALLAAVEDTNAVLPPDMQLSTSAEAVLFGLGGKLDSLGLVNFVLAAEERLADAGLSVSLTDERAMSQKRSPFRSIRTLSQFVQELIADGTNATC